jgi:MoaA/NifB/PqqE/SkfB family radical SAM enzyme
MTFIDSRHKLFGHLDRLVGWQHGEHPAPVTVEWDLSNRCALGCMDCHFAHTHTRGPWASKPRTLPMAYDSGGDLADIDVVRRGLDQMARIGVKGIVWSGGGEPTTHPRWQDVIDYASSLGLQQGMYTFGGLFDEKSATHLARHAEWVVVSLDAPDEHTYAHEKGVQSSRFFAACDGIGWLAQVKKATVGVSFLLHADNWTRAGEMLSLARALGATYITFRPAVRTTPDAPSTCTDDRSWITAALPNLKDYESEPDVECDVDRFLQYRDWTTRSYSTCHGVKLTTTITPDGRLWMCPQHRGVPGSCLGDLKTESFKDIWYRHGGTYTQFDNCRVMCRLHLMNETLAQVYAQHEHGAFL